MFNYLYTHAGWVAIALIVLWSFLVVLARAFRWSRRRAARLEHAQRCIGAITWPGTAGCPYGVTLGTVISSPPPARTARSELRSLPR